MERFERKELKYRVPNEVMEPLRERLLQHMAYDPFCVDKEQNRYEVRSVYLDSSRLLFYWEKQDGLKIRKKLRIRGYGETGPNSPVFLEIKRKHDDTIFKERVSIPFDESYKLMNGANIIRPNNGKNDLGEMTLNRFIYLTKRLQLTPKSLITYDREAFIGVENPSVRATFDINIASYPTENIEDIYTENRLRQITNTFFVLELKFNEIMPSWMHRIVRDFSLRLDSYSKYCSGIDAWTSRGGEVIINS